MIKNKAFIPILSITVTTVLLAGVYFLNTYLSHTSNLTPVTIHYNQVSGATVELYKGTTEDLVEPNTQGDPVLVEPGSEHILEDWPYVVLVKGEGIAKTNQIIYPNQTPQTVHISVSADEEMLSDSLAREEPSIRASLLAAHPNLPHLYDIQGVSLHGDGTWATAALSYTGPDKWSRDTLHVVLRHSGSWEVVAGPSISIHQTDKLKTAPRSLFWSVLPKEVPSS